MRYTYNEFEKYRTNDIISQIKYKNVNYSQTNPSTLEKQFMIFNTDTSELIKLFFTNANNTGIITQSNQIYPNSYMNLRHNYFEEDFYILTKEYYNIPSICTNDIMEKIKLLFLIFGSISNPYDNEIRILHDNFVFPKEIIPYIDKFIKNYNGFDPSLDDDEPHIEYPRQTINKGILIASLFIPEIVEIVNKYIQPIHFVNLAFVLLDKSKYQHVSLEILLIGFNNIINGSSKFKTAYFTVIKWFYLYIKDQKLTLKKSYSDYIVDFNKAGLYPEFTARHEHSKAAYNINEITNMILYSYLIFLLVDTDNYYLLNDIYYNSCNYNCMDIFNDIKVSLDVPSNYIPILYELIKKSPMLKKNLYCLFFKIFAPYIIETNNEDYKKLLSNNTITDDGILKWCSYNCEKEKLNSDKTFKLLVELLNSKNRISLINTYNKKYYYNSHTFDLHELVKKYINIYFINSDVKENSNTPFYQSVYSMIMDNSSNYEISHPEFHWYKLFMIINLINDEQFEIMKKDIIPDFLSLYFNNKISNYIDINKTSINITQINKKHYEEMINILCDNMDNTNDLRKVRSKVMLTRQLGDFIIGLDKSDITVLITSYDYKNKEVKNYVKKMVLKSDLNI